jgi:hypothetical protein
MNPDTLCDAADEAADEAANIKSYIDSLNKKKKAVVDTPMKKLKRKSDEMKKKKHKSNKLIDDEADESNDEEEAEVHDDYDGNGAEESDDDDDEPVGEDDNSYKLNKNGEMVVNSSCEEDEDEDNIDLVDVASENRALDESLRKFKENKKKSKRRIAESSDDDEEEEPVVVAKKKKKPVVVSSESEDEEPVKKKKKPELKPKKREVSEDEEEEIKPVKQKKREVVSDDEEEEIKPVKQKKREVSEDEPKKIKKKQESEDEIEVEVKKVEPVKPKMVQSKLTSIGNLHHDFGSSSSPIVKKGTPLKLGDIIKIGQNLYRITYLGKRVKFSGTPDLKEIDYDVHTVEHFSTLFCITKQTDKCKKLNKERKEITVDIPNFKIYFIPEDSHYNPIAVSQLVAKNIEITMIRNNKVLFNDWINQQLIDRNGEVGVTADGKHYHRMYTAQQLYQKRADKVFNKAEDGKHVKPKVVVEVSVSSVVEAVDDRCAFLHDDKFVRDLFQPAFSKFVKDVDAATLEKMFKRVQNTFKSLVDKHKEDEDPIAVFEEAKVKIGKHVLDIAFMLPFLHPAFRAMVEEKLNASKPVVVVKPVVVAAKPVVVAAKPVVVAAKPVVVAAKPVVVAAKPVVVKPVVAKPVDDDDIKPIVKKVVEEVKFWVCRCDHRVTGDVCPQCETPREAPKSAASTIESITASALSAIIPIDTELTEKGWDSLDAPPSQDEQIKMDEELRKESEFGTFA